MSREQQDGVGHGVRAMTFWDPRGLEARRALAESFAGPEGRVATVADLVSARLAATENDAFLWEYAFVGETRMYVGLDRANRPVAIVTQGVGPRPVPIGTIPGFGRVCGPWGRPAIRRADFLAMLDDRSVPGQAVVDLESYARFHAETAHGGGHKWQVLLNAEMAAQDPLLRAIFGESLTPYAARLCEEAEAWTGTPGAFPLSFESRDQLARLDDLRKKLADSDAWDAAFVYRAELGARVRCEARTNPACPRTYRCAVILRADDFIDECLDLGLADLHLVVGIRPGNGPLTRVAQAFDMKRPAIHANWRAFAGAIAPEQGPSAPTDGGLVELMQWRESFFAIAERVSCGGKVPGARVSTATPLPVSLPIRAEVVKTGEHSHQGLLPEAIAANAPEGTTAYIVDRYEWSRLDDADVEPHIDVWIRYFRAEFDDTPMHFLMRVADDLFTQYPHPDKERPRGTRKPRAWASVAEPLGQPRELRGVTEDELRENAWVWVAALRTQAPPGANAVLLDERGQNGTAQFYRVEIDHAFGLRHPDDQRTDVHDTARRMEALGLA